VDDEPTMEQQQPVEQTAARLACYFKAGYPSLYLKSDDEAQALEHLFTAAKAAERKLIVWNIVEGAMLWTEQDGKLRNEVCDEFESMQQQYAPLIWVSTAADAQSAVVVLPDYHQFMQPDPRLTRMYKTAVAAAERSGVTLVIVANTFKILPELERTTVLVTDGLPSRELLRTKLRGLVADALKTSPPDEDIEQALDAAAGLTLPEATNAFALSLVETKSVCPEVIYREKAEIIHKTDILEIYQPKETLEDIGGLEELKHWLVKHVAVFSEEGKKFGLTPLKGLLLTGIPGTGKSLAARATANIFKRPMLRLDVGKLMGSLQGQSEERTRQALQLAEAISPSILFIDEVEKGLAGMGGSGQTDNGTASRVCATLLTWMQEHTKPVFVVMTSNDITKLPPEFTRKGRVDEVFFVDLPTAAERKVIWRIQLRKQTCPYKGIDFDKLTAASKGFTGSEIEQCVIEAAFDAFDAGDNALSTRHLLHAAAACVPMSKTRASEITALSTWAKVNARAASATEVLNVSRLPVRKLN